MCCATVACGTAYFSWYDRCCCRCFPSCTIDGDDRGDAQGWREGSHRNAAGAVGRILHTLRPRGVGGRQRTVASSLGPHPRCRRAKGEGCLGQVSACRSEVGLSVCGFFYLVDAFFFADIGLFELPLVRSGDLRNMNTEKTTQYLLNGASACPLVSQLGTEYRTFRWR